MYFLYSTNMLQYSLFKIKSCRAVIFSAAQLYPCCPFFAVGIAYAVCWVGCAIPFYLAAAGSIGWHRKEQNDMSFQRIWNWISTYNLVFPVSILT